MTLLITLDRIPQERLFWTLRLHGGVSWDGGVAGYFGTDMDGAILDVVARCWRNWR